MPVALGIAWFLPPPHLTRSDWGFRAPNYSHMLSEQSMEDGMSHQFERRDLNRDADALSPEIIALLALCGAEIRDGDRVERRRSDSERRRKDRRRQDRRQG